MNLFLKCFGLFLFLSISLQAGKIDVYVPMKGEPVLVPDDELGVLDVDFTALVERHIDRSAARRSGLLRRRLEVRMFPGAGGPSTWEMGTVMEVTREGGTVILLDNGETVHRGYEFFFPAGGCPNFRFSDEVSVEISFHVALHELGARWLQNETDDGDEVAEYVFLGLSDALDGPAGRGRTVRNAIAHAIEHSDGPRFRMLLTQHLGQIRHSDQTFLISYFSVLAIDIANNGNYSLMREFIRGIEDLTLLVPHYVFGEIADALRRYRDAFFAEDSHDRRGFDGLIDLLKEKIGAIEEKKRREARLRFRRRYF